MKDFYRYFFSQTDVMMINKPLSSHHGTSAAVMSCLEIILILERLDSRYLRITNTRKASELALTIHLAVVDFAILTVVYALALDRQGRLPTFVQR